MYINEKERPNTTRKRQVRAGKNGAGKIEEGKDGAGKIGE